MCGRAQAILLEQHLAKPVDSSIFAANVSRLWGTIINGDGKQAAGGCLHPGQIHGSTSESEVHGCTLNLCLASAPSAIEAIIIGGPRIRRKPSYGKVGGYSGVGNVIRNIVDQAPDDVDFEQKEGKNAKRGCSHRALSVE